MKPQFFFISDALKAKQEHLYNLWIGEEIYN